MYNMLGESSVTDRFINSIYKYIDVGVLVTCDKNERRKIQELAFFDREDGINNVLLYMKIVSLHPMIFLRK